jgi:type IV secretory pathway VirB2 component (pilin)
MEVFMFSKKQFLRVLTVVAICAMAATAGASVESSLMTIQTKLVGTILPLVAILGIVFAGFSYLSGNANARNHLILAIVGAVVGFGASSIVSFLRGLIQ